MGSSMRIVVAAGIGISAALAWGLAARSTAAAPVEPPAGTVELRFKLTDAPRALHAHALFAVADRPAGAPDLSEWLTLDVTNVDESTRMLEAMGATDISARPDLTPAVLVHAPEDGPALDGDACPIKTPAYDARQRYIAAIHATAAWQLPGGRGQGVQVADVEGGWNDAHEDLPALSHVAGRKMGTGWSAHGTAVLGVVAAKDNGIGMTGLARDVDHIYTASLGGIGAARALTEAAKVLSPGDVLIVELHGPGPNARGRGQQGYVPMEWWQPEFDAIRYATSKGIIVVEAAGNGGEDLDAPVYQGKFDRTVRDSGAILVGAGAQTGIGIPARSRLAFSNHGARVDVQGWGGGVATLDYGDLQGCASASRKYTALFSGTSSASPVVAGAVLELQGAYKARHRRPLPPLKMRELLRATGQAQLPSDTAPITQHIGPLPDVASALLALGIAGDTTCARCGADVSSAP